MRLFLLVIQLQKLDYSEVPYYETPTYRKIKRQAPSVLQNFASNCYGQYRSQKNSNGNFQNKLYSLRLPDFSNMNFSNIKWIFPPYYINLNR